MSKILYSLRGAKKILRKDKFSKNVIVTSNSLAKKLSWAVRKLGVQKENVILLPDGEKAKEWKELEKLLKEFSKLNLDRNSILIALGGGAIGDVTGFAASIYLRGIKYIQVPTTLLAQVDSAHGGKTGINFLGLKNQLGTSNLPIATIIDARFIRTLPDESIVDGLGEIIKAGFLKDISILSLLKKHDIDSFSKSPDLAKIILKAIKVKQFYINKDFRDNNQRQLLNFGHTIGHAIELKYKISHGRAVIYGMLKELQIMESLKLTPHSVRQNLMNILDHLGIKIDTNMKSDWHNILHDKKVAGNKIIFPVVEKEGKAKLIKLDLKTLKKFL